MKWEDNPCHNCTERTERCHVTCKKHREWLIENKKRKEAIRERARYDSTILSPGYISTHNKKLKRMLQGRKNH